MTTNTTTRTREAVQTYHQARFAGDIPAAAAQLAGTFTFQSSLISSGDAHGHLAGLTGFLQVVTSVEMISELYGESEATLVYDVHTATPVGTQHTAEHFRVRDGLIESISLIFDATRWHPIMATVAPTAPAS